MEELVCRNMSRIRFEGMARALVANCMAAILEYHNAVRLAQAWCNVSLGFTVSPSDIVTPNAVFMLILTTFLYEILPTLFPKETVGFQTGLTMDVTRKVQLVNPSPHRVAYSAKFIGDESSFFSLEKPTSIIYIKPREKAFITLRYQARKIRIVKTTLVLCGTMLSPNFAKHLVFTLEGEPIHLQTSDSFSLSAPLCRPTEVAIPIRPPYPVPAEYEICCTETEPTNTRTFTAEPWREMRKRKVPRRLFINKGRLLCTNPAEENSPLGMTVACLAPKSRDFWLVFMHPDVGDFIVKISIAPRKADAQDNITCGLPPGRHQGPCFCEATWETRDVGTDECPLRSFIPVPMRNAELWNAVRVMFEKALDEQERDFWSKHLETNIGLRLIQWLLGDTKDSVSAEFEHIFQTSVTYSVVCSAPTVIRVPARLTIPDVRLTTDIDMPIHVSSTTPSPYHVTLTLTSDSGQEIRNYHVHLVDSHVAPSIMSTTQASKSG